jgi:fluoride ion exporter CrcB/FEX
MHFVVSRNAWFKEAITGTFPVSTLVINNIANIATLVFTEKVCQ